MNQQALSEFLFVQETHLDPGDAVAATRAIEQICLNELRAQLKTCNVRALGSKGHRFQAGAGATLATLTGWVEQLGDRDVVIRAVAATRGVEIVDVSIRFELVPASNNDPVAVDVAATHVATRRTESERPAAGVRRVEVLQ